MDTEEMQAILQDLSEVAQKDKNRLLRSNFENRYNICKLCGKHVYKDVEVCEKCEDIKK